MTFQNRVKDWLVACFSKCALFGREERTHRFLEEALELSQACGCLKGEALALVDYVFARPVGDVDQEVGGVMVTLAALSSVHNIELDHAAETELRHNWQRSDVIRSKRDARPVGSPLPQ